MYREAENVVKNSAPFANQFDSPGKSLSKLSPFQTQYLEKIITSLLMMFTVLKQARNADHQ